MNCSTRMTSSLKVAIFLMGMLGFALDTSDGFTPGESLIHSSQTLLRQHHSVNTALNGFKRSNIEKPKKPKKKREQNFKKLTASNDMMTSHRHRLETAGKIGTQRYADPNMVFIGNLNFTVTDDELRDLVVPLVPSPWDIAKVQVVRDWKTGESKGYGFVRFTEAVFATLALQELDNKEYQGRRLKLKAASSRSESPLRMKQREEKERMKAIRRLQNPPQPPPAPKNENSGFLGLLDADLIIPTLDDQEDFDDEVDGWEVPGSPAPKGFG